MAGDEPAVELRHADEARRAGAEVPAELVRRDAEVLDVDKRRCREIGEEAAERRDEHDRGGEKAPVAKQRQRPGERAQERGAAPVHRMRLLEEPSDQDEAEHRERAEEAEDPVPRAVHQQPAAAERREDRRRAHHQHHEREHPRRLDLVEAIPDHRADHHHPRSAAERLRETQHHEVIDGASEDAARRGDREHRDAAQERRLAAVAVGDRAEQQLPEREAEQIGRQGVLHARRRHRELGRERQQRRQIHVDRERAQRHHQAENQREPPYPVFSL